MGGQISQQAVIYRPSSGMLDEDGVDAAKSFSSRKNARKIFIPEEANSSCTKLLKENIKFVFFSAESAGMALPYDLMEHMVT